MLKFVHKNKDGVECIPLHIWVSEYGTEEDQRIHDDPNPITTEKRDLIDRYYKSLEVHSIEVYEDNVFVKEMLLSEHLTAQTGKPAIVDPDAVRVLYITAEGKIAEPIFSIWVHENGNEEDKKVHDNPEDSAEKRRLFHRYLRDVNVLYSEVWKGDERISINDLSQEMLELEETLAGNSLDNEGK